ncbi:hypothetical protein HNY73_021053 [Argiope bruennichi]|uniref:Uncharacterized protein n=1 Tax=Argiope bruennichi TaxID=94029 RepID=A0A8T0EA57_ARGBR|nr:hypothetical protein HNY73_021053 [Argiope bruennichi]
MVATSGFRQFVILLYKGLLLRKRHYIITFFEIVIPVFVASILCIMQAQQTYDVNKPKGNLWVDFATYEPFDPFGQARRSDRPVELVYTPNNDLSRPIHE